ncbi:hypothetical protein GCM10009745_19770 [Kribbella yunnanensis]|uniref:Uncharacterized protein n=1 Tax=Kribbella yunnanensis TaxID=190194 RepID=A0ABN2GTH8_9ACTN
MARDGVDPVGAGAGRGWNIRRINPTTLEWTAPHGFVCHVDPTGTHRLITSEG